MRLSLDEAMSLSPDEFEDWEAAARARKFDEFLFLSAIAVRAQVPDKKIAAKRNRQDQEIREERLKELLIWEDLIIENQKATQARLRASVQQGKFRKIRQIAEAEEKGKKENISGNVKGNSHNPQAGRKRVHKRTR